MGGKEQLQAIQLDFDEHSLDLTSRKNNVLPSTQETPGTRAGDKIDELLSEIPGNAATSYVDNASAASSFSRAQA